MSAKLKLKTDKLDSVRKLTDYENQSNINNLKALIANHVDEEKKLIELIGFRKEYQDRSINEASKSCATIQQAQNNRRFLNKISIAINHQQEKLVELTKQIDESIQLWKQSHQRNRAVEKLIEGYQYQYSQLLSRYEQYSSDEQISRGQYKASHMLR